jgi:hypothetical protein
LLHKHSIVPFVFSSSSSPSFSGCCILLWHYEVKKIPNCEVSILNMYIICDLQKKRYGNDNELRPILDRYSVFSLQVSKD